MNCPFVLVDLSDTTDPVLSSYARLHAGLLALRYGTRKPEEQMAALEQIAQALQAVPELLVPVMRYLLATFSCVDGEVVQQIVKRVKPAEEAEMMSIFAQEMMAKGEARGEARGITSTLLRQLQRKFGPLPLWVKNRIEEADLPTLEGWTDSILDARSLEEVFEQKPAITTH